MSQNHVPTAHQKSALKNIVQFTSSNFYRHMLGLATAFFRPGLLGPELFGIWSLLNVIPFYANFAHLGTRSAMRFKLAELAEQNSKELNRYTHTTLVVTIVATSVLAIVMIGYGINASLAPEMQYGLYAMAIIIFLNALYEHYGAEAKGYHNFTLVSQTTIIRYTLNFVFGLSFIWFWGLYGALLALGLSCFIALCFLLRKTPISTPSAANMPLAKSLVKTGSPIMALDLVNLTLRNIDKVLVASFLGAKALGIYAIAGILVGVMINIPGSSREVTEQLLMAENKQAAKEAILEQYMIKGIRLNAYLMPLVIAVMCYALPVFITWFLPAFNESILPAQWLLIGAFFLTLSYPVRGIIVFNQWQAKASLVAFIAVLIAVLMLVITLNTGNSLTSVALAASLSFVALFLLLSWFVYSRYQLPFSQFVKEALSCLLPFSVLLISYLISMELTALNWPILLSQLLSGLIFLMMYLPLLYRAAKSKHIALPTKLLKKLKREKGEN